MDSVDKDKFWRKRGRIEVSGKTFDDYPEFTMRITAQMLIDHAHFDAMRNVHTYVGYSNQFDEIDMGTVIPFYQVQQYSDGRLSFSRLHLHYEPLPIYTKPENPNVRKSP